MCTVYDDLTCAVATQAYFYSALYNTGLSSLDSETRRKLSPAEVSGRSGAGCTPWGAV